MALAAQVEWTLSKYFENLRLTFLLGASLLAGRHCMYVCSICFSDCALSVAAVPRYMRKRGFPRLRVTCLKVDLHEFHAVLDAVGLSHVPFVNFHQVVRSLRHDARRIREALRLRSER